MTPGEAGEAGSRTGGSPENDELVEWNESFLADFISSVSQASGVKRSNQEDVLEVLEAATHANPGAEVALQPSANSSAPARSG